MQRKDQKSVVEVVVKTLGVLNQYNNSKKEDPSSSDDLESIVYALIQILRHIDWDSGVELFPKHDLTGLTSIFSNILESGIEFKTVIVTILMAYFSIHPSLNQLIINSNCQWNLYFKSDGSNITKSDLYPGFYTVIKEIEKFKTFNKRLLSFMQFDFLQDTLINSWIPMWELKKDNNTLNLDWNYYSSRNLLPDLLKDESMTDFFLVNNMNNNQLYITQAPKFKLLLLQLYRRVLILNGKWVKKDFYNQVLHNMLNVDDDNIDSLNFALKVLMEIIDHPEYNYMEESKLVLLLYLALVKLEKVPVTQLHTILSEMGTTQSLISIVNMTQFFIAQFLNKLQLVSEKTSMDDITKLQTGKTRTNIRNEISSQQNGKNKLSKFEIPNWFKNEISPDIPPIAKSLFIFDTSVNEVDSLKLSFTETLNILSDCLNLTILVHNNIINQYHALNISLLQSDSTEKNDINVNIEYLLKQNFFQLNYIPIFTTMLTVKNMFKNGTDGLIFKNGVTSIKKVITLNSIKYIESLIISYKDIALYHLLKFISTISQENLILQKISIQILNHLFFHNNDNDFTYLLCKNNKLSLNEIYTYIRLWNDGTPNYSLFFTELFNEKQPMVNIKKIDLRQLQELIPNMDVVIKYQETIDNKKKSCEYKSKGSRNYSASSSDYNNSGNYGYNQSNDNRNGNHNTTMLPQPIQPVPQKTMKNYMTSAKYDAYSSPVFIPSQSNSANNTTMVSSTSNNIIASGGNFTPQPQQMINPGNAIYSTPYSYMQQQTMNPMNGLDTNVDTSTATTNGLNMPGMNPNDMCPPGNFSMQTNFMSTPQATPMVNSTNNGNVPMINTNNNPVFTSPWNESPTMTSYTPQNKIVNTGKNYILGGHNRVKNNSRAQSIHIDQFENI